METKETEIMATLPAVRPILEQIANKWAILVLTFVCDKPQRFNVIKRRLDGITQKALTETLRRLERNGLVARRVIPVSPVAVEYSITKLGRTLQDPFAALYDWSVTHQSEIEKAQSQFDAFATASKGCGNLEGNFEGPTA
ncbi:Transcriptional regulator, HxlR family [Acidisarcina polymorpha]|uniref:Transcriptional regulator, HxlR family n=1 Tax=Acidisarcina polymorpha TaxID=2211140 RepID=A0A2Z5FVJ0_9BACT|nr:helix-turn-helix domain-containing protein [Acidisarcina polymorpha]AXC10760.1 Transcriptional regulator, HxlR family [Acidisarcina polymorpha]